MQWRRWIGLELLAIFHFKCQVVQCTCKTSASVCVRLLCMSLCPFISKIYSCHSVRLFHPSNLTLTYPSPPQDEVVDAPSADGGADGVGREAGKHRGHHERPARPDSRPSSWVSWNKRRRYLCTLDGKKTTKGNLEIYLYSHPRVKWSKDDFKCYWSLRCICFLIVTPQIGFLWYSQGFR